MRLPIRESLFLFSIALSGYAHAEGPLAGSLQSFIRAGPQIDVSQFSHLRPIDLSPSSDHVAKQPLGDDVAKIARPDFGDVRVVDGSAHLVPFVIAGNGKDATLYIVGAGGSYVLLVGNSTLTHQDQPIDQARDLVLHAQATEARVERLMHNPDERDLSDKPKTETSAQPVAPASCSLHVTQASRAPPLCLALLCLYGWLTWRTSKRRMALSEIGNTQSCYGDSRSPLVREVSGKLRAFGVVSGGLPSKTSMCDYGTVFASFNPEVMDFLNAERKWVDPCKSTPTTGICEKKTSSAVPSQMKVRAGSYASKCGLLGQTCGSDASGAAVCIDRR